MIEMSVADRVALDALLSRYTGLGDSGRVEEFAALFTEDGVLTVAGRRFVGPDEIVAFAEQSGAAMAAITSLLPGAHHVSSRMTELVSDDSATSQSLFMFVGTSGPDHWGTYRDHLIRTGDGWRFVSRSVRFTGFSPSSGVRGYVESLARS
ncbi:SnoaL-like protein [Williamsia limnetica]|uniref:SnoaL-like protein n=2 Tax=Williamsia TaxID=85043 RepID=A0A318RLI9_WILLI|nr:MULTISPECIES: nuclear transport factor 2 family protein [Williamsia]MDV7136525.1 nuclear transport factor 2 family protein [Williamsia muralis]PYE16952.1 SnoaL-like protein [Williamsia limnetica]